MAEAYVQCWFIGGPWNNRLESVPAVLIVGSRRARWRVPDGRALPPMDWTADGALITNETFPVVDYWLQPMLETGVPCFSCLEGACEPELMVYYFALRSVLPGNLPQRDDAPCGTIR